MHWVTLLLLPTHPEIYGFFLLPSLDQQKMSPSNQLEYKHVFTRHFV